MTIRGYRSLFVSTGFLLVTATFCCSCSSRRTEPTVSGKTSLLPPSHYTMYYSTQKARQLGETYGENLDQLLERLTQSSVGKLQFVNTIVSLSLGFFSHSASATPDDRYLEVILGMPDILEDQADLLPLVRQLLSQYGGELLSILAQDQKIANDGKIAGYGLHFSWRGLQKTPSGPHLTLREAVIYLNKDQAQRFLSRQLTQDDLLHSAVLFLREGDQPARQVFYPPPERSLPTRLLPLDDTTPVPFDAGSSEAVARDAITTIRSAPPSTTSPPIK